MDTPLYDIDTHNSSSALIGGSATVIHCTIVNNNARNGVFNDSNVSVTNSIVYFNYGSGGDINTATTNVSYTLTSVTNHLVGVGNITNAPIFVDFAANDFQFAGRSPGIDAGIEATDPVTGLTINHDIVGQIRPIDGTGLGIAKYDMGAYEYRPTPGTIIMLR